MVSEGSSVYTEQVVGRMNSDCHTSIPTLPPPTLTILTMSKRASRSSKTTVPPHVPPTVLIPVLPPLPLSPPPRLPVPAGPKLPGAPGARPLPNMRQWIAICRWRAGEGRGQRGADSSPIRGAYCVCRVSPVSGPSQT